MKLLILALLGLLVSTHATQPEAQGTLEAESDVEVEAEEVESIPRMKPMLRARQKLESVSEHEQSVQQLVQQLTSQKWHVYSDMATETAHESISKLAMKLLADGGAQFDIDRVLPGVIWNDMPNGGDENEAVLDGHLDVDTFGKQFANQLSTKLGGSDKTYLLYASHYGCLQHFHSMAPIMYDHDGMSPQFRVSFTNTDVRTLILSQLEAWWNRIVKEFKFADHADAPVRMRQMGGATDRQSWSWITGHMLHTLQDSYPRGHVVRNSENLYPARHGDALQALAQNCGQVIYFQGYDAQHGNSAHKKADYSPNKVDKESDVSLRTRHNCAIYYSNKLLADLTACFASNDKDSGACNFGTTPRVWLEAEVYAIPGTNLLTLAGGSALEFAKPNILSDTAFVLQYIGAIPVMVPASTATWGGLENGSGRKAYLCGRNSINGMKPTGLGGYISAAYTKFENPSKGTDDENSRPCYVIGNVVHKQGAGECKSSGLVANCGARTPCQAANAHACPGGSTCRCIQGGYNSCACVTNAANPDNERHHCGPITKPTIIG